MVAYEITIKERGYRPEPYAIADALILADGKPIVAVTNMALQLSGTEQRRARTPVGRAGAIDRASCGRRPLAESETHRQRRRASPLFDHDRILAFAIGKPSVGLRRALSGVRSRADSSPGFRGPRTSFSTGSRGSTPNPG